MLPTVELADRLSAIGAVLIEGPKACGKTATASQVAATMVRLDEDYNARAALTLNPSALFDQPTPIVFDEWQVVPEIWNRVRRQVDDRGERRLFILTGSATPRDDANRHSGAGRIGTIRMRPMSLFESGTRPVRCPFPHSLTAINRLGATTASTCPISLSVL